MSLDGIRKKQGTERFQDYRIEGHSILSEDEILDGRATVPDRIVDPQRRVLEGPERQRFIDHIRTRLGVETVRGLSLPRLQGFFAAQSRAQDFLQSRAYHLGFLQATFAAANARDGGFSSESIRRRLTDLIAQLIAPGIQAAEGLLYLPPLAREIWDLLNQEPFQSFRSRQTLQNLERDGVLDSSTLQRIEGLYRDLLQRGIDAAAVHGRNVINTGGTPNHFMSAWIVLSGLRNAAIRIGLSFDRREIDRCIGELETLLSPGPAQLDLMRALVE